MKIKGEIKYQSIGVGAWTLVSDTGEVYELYKPPLNICQDGLKIEIQGIIRDDIMTTAMLGKILEISKVY
ncbi:hypothetical protein [Geminocystis sp. NIES-3709]|uniref:hypothetical protein n=1 Tax=Geminocystis sp. NIES-3709 TaxID=1617448 RepID=UPI0005FC68E3|nr:hypothetical protein [Geminocystis sp. NIES-3709]BAQ64198.1 hypothetical protein GM3709_963 [Geminocystis sp. NIES-3709]